MVMRVVMMDARGYVRLSRGGIVVEVHRLGVILARRYVEMD